MEPPFGGGGGAERPGVRRLAPTSPLDDRKGESEDRDDELLLPADSNATRQSSASGIPGDWDSAAINNKYLSGSKIPIVEFAIGCSHSRVYNASMRS